MRDVTLKIPLRPFAFRRRRQRGHATDARIQPLRDAFDDAALARGVAAFEDDDDLVFGLHDPVLQLHQFPLQAEQLAEVTRAVIPERQLLLRIGLLSAAGNVILKLQFELFVEAVHQVAMDAVRPDRCFARFVGAHAATAGFDPWLRVYFQ